jgi:hypothetical protein
LAEPTELLAATINSATGIREVVAREDLDQGRLSGAVLAKQSVNLTRLDREADVIQRSLPRKGLGDVLQSDRRD